MELSKVRLVEPVLRSSLFSVMVSVTVPVGSESSFTV